MIFTLNSTFPPDWNPKGDKEFNSFTLGVKNNLDKIHAARIAESKWNLRKTLKQIK